MNTVERGAAIISVLVVAFGAGAAWNSLSDRIDKVDDKIGEIQKTLGSTPCTAILARQMDAIDKGRADVRKALDGLSDQYGCETTRNTWAPAMNETATTAEMNATAERHRPVADTAELNRALNAVDVQLSKKK